MTTATVLYDADTYVTRGLMGTQAQVDEFHALGGTYCVVEPAPVGCPSDKVVVTVKGTDEAVAFVAGLCE